MEVVADDMRSLTPCLKVLGQCVASEVEVPVLSPDILVCLQADVSGRHDQMKYAQALDC
jgi:hypothetical protein